MPFYCQHSQRLLPPLPESSGKTTHLDIFYYKIKLGTETGKKLKGQHLVNNCQVYSLPRYLSQIPV